MTVTLALDVGGTHMRAAVFQEQAIKPYCQKRIRTYAEGQTSIDRLLGLIKDVTPPGEVIQSIGIALPGLIDPQEHIILIAPNLPEWVGIPINRIVEAEFSAPTRIGNDAKLATVGEWQYGAGQGHHHVLYLTISTGIGGGVICDDHLIVGSKGFGTEFGHVTILPEGPLCGCGQRGHLEAIASGPGIASYFAEQLKLGRTSILQGTPDAKAISQAAREDDTLAKEAFDRAGYYLGLMIANYLAIFNPSIVILGGGVSQSGDVLLDPVRAQVQKSVLSEHYLENLIITLAALGDDAGLYGALALARGLL